VQGAEEEALRDAHDLLKDAHVVICKADIEDFQNLNRLLDQAGFVLYDVTELNRVGDGTLGWFHPVYVNRALDFVRPKEFWEEKYNAGVIFAQVERRKAILESNAQILARLRNQHQPIESKQSTNVVGRNYPCPCGSGKKYKHCCGSYR
jgi:SEC-C motif